MGTAITYRNLRARSLALVGALVVLASAANAQLHLDDVEATGGLAFVENRGQWDTSGRFVARWGASRLWLEEDSIWLHAREGALEPGGGALVVLRFEGASEHARLVGEHERPELYNFFLGNDPERWQTRVPGFGQVVYRGLRPGVDVAVHGRSGAPKYDLRLERADLLSDLAIACEGSLGMRIADDGALVIRTAAGALRQVIPASWQTSAAGTRIPATCRFVLLDETRFGFELVDGDPSLPLTIDPGLEWASYVGGPNVIGQGDQATAVDVAPDGSVVVVGWTDSESFPTTPGAVVLVSGLISEDVFITRFEAGGTKAVYSSLVGGLAVVGLNEDRPWGVAIDELGRATVTGWTRSADFPSTPGAFDPVYTPTLEDQSEGFVFRLTPLGDELVYSTFLGSTDDDTAWDVVVDDSGAAYVVGETANADFPTTPGAFDTTEKLGDGFVTKLSPDGSSLEWSTLFGAGKTDLVKAVAIDTDGNVFVTGRTSSDQHFATPGAFDTTFNDLFSGVDAFVAKISADGTQKLWVTYLGGSSSAEYADGIGVDAFGRVAITGSTRSFDFPVTPGAFDPDDHPGPGTYGDAYVTVLDPTGSSLVYSTYLGTSYQDHAWDLHMDPSGIVTVGGFTDGDFPTTAGSFGPDVNHGKSDNFLTRVDPDGSRLLYSTHLGGPEIDTLRGMAIQAPATAVAAGRTTGSFPVTAGAWDTSYNGGQTDGVVALLDLLPAGTSRYATSSPACLGPIGMGATTLPAAGEAAFELFASAAPPDGLGFLVVGFDTLVTPLVLGGASIWIDVAQPSFFLPVLADAYGYLETPLPLPGGIEGAPLACQYVFVDDASCGGFGTLSASDALEIVVQPAVPQGQ